MIRRVPASGCSVQKVPECPNPGRTTSRPFGRCGSSSSVAACGGVAKSSSPPMRSVSTFDARTRAVLVLVRLAGQASASRPPPQVNAVAASPRFEAGFRLPEEKDAVAAAASILAAAAHLDPRRTTRGTQDRPGATGTRIRSRRRRRRQSHASSVIGPESGPSPHRTSVSMSPKKEATRTLPVLDRQEEPALGHVRGRLPHRRREVVRPRAAARRPASSARRSGRSARRWSFASQRKWPGGLTAIITERWMLSG